MIRPVSDVGHGGSFVTEGEIFELFDDDKTRYSSLYYMKRTAHELGENMSLLEMVEG